MRECQPLARKYGFGVGGGGQKIYILLKFDSLTSSLNHFWILVYEVEFTRLFFTVKIALQWFCCMKNADFTQTFFCRGDA